VLRPVFFRIRNLSRQIFYTSARSVIHCWPPYTRLFLVSDSPVWVLSEEMREVGAIARQLEINIARKRWLKQAKNQAIFYASQFILLKDQWKQLPHRIALAYFHGHPGTPGYSEFDRCYERLCQNHHCLHRIQVSHTQMRDIVLSSGISPEKVFLIPIGINLFYFFMQTSESRRKARLVYGIPDSAVVVGSFQKDGVGWDEGLEPKLIKGPDVFLRTLEILKSRIPELFVLLSGPARGYVKRGLDRLGIPYRHYFLKHYSEVGQLFQALDVYIVSSRQEGGPKAILEAMASGVPLVTTRVGQAMDLVVHQQNGWMVDVEDAEGLAHWAEYASTHRNSLENILNLGYKTAEANSYESQIPLWRDFMKGFVNCAQKTY
jgi:glycosyltransferase involved in cell wall biosynthesis